MKSIGISFYILPGFREDCLCAWGGMNGSVKRSSNPPKYGDYERLFFRVFERTVCVAWGGMFGRWKQFNLV